MKILAISSFSQASQLRSPYEDAVSTYLYNLLNNFSKEEEHLLSVHVLANTLQTDCASGSEDFVSRGGVKIVVERVFSPGIFSLPRLAWRVCLTKADIIHIQHEMFLFGGFATILMFPVFLALSRLRARVVVTLHHVVSINQVRWEEYIHHKLIGCLPYFVFRVGFRIFYRLVGIYSNKIIVHEYRWKNVLENEYHLSPAKIVVVPHGVEDVSKAVSLSREELFREFGIPRGVRHVIGFFGFLSPNKDLDYLLSEFEKFAAQESGSVLMIAGGPTMNLRYNKTYNTYLSNLRIKYNQILPGRVMWMGPVSSSQVGKFFKTIDCLVLPYKECFGSSGPLSLAQGSGVPYFVSEAFRGLVPENGNAFFSMRGGSLVNILNNHFQHREAHNQSDNSVVANKTWDVASKLTIKIFRELIGSASPRIVLVGAYGQGNLGDEILLSSCLSKLRGARCVVASSQPDLTEAEHLISAVHAHRKFNSLLRTILRSNVVVVGGGDQLKILKSSYGRSKYSLLFLLLLLTIVCRITGKEILLLGVGIGDISSTVGTFLTRWILKHVSLVTFRDNTSYEKCISLGAANHALLGSDLAFISPKMERISVITHSRRESFLGIAPTFNIDHASHYPRVVTELSLAIDGVLKEKCASAVFLPFQTSYSSHNDIATSEEIVNKVINKDLCYIDRSFSIKSYSAQFESIQILWGMRLHSLILACLHAVPFIALIYDIKVKNFLDEIGCSEWGLSLDDSFSAATLLQLHHRLVENMDNVRAHLYQQAALLQERSLVNADVLQAVACGDKILFESLLGVVNPIHQGLHAISR
ncbi:MAG: polysaccharide pyruvyl transferase family protein [Candidatus Peribacteraceae bacterium]